MSDVADLWKRIEEARKRLGTDDETQVKQVEDINEQVKEVRSGLARRYRELEQHREEVSKLRRENEQLRRMLHRLLLAIEQRQGSRLRKLMEGLEGEVNALVPLAADPTKKEGTAESAPVRPIEPSVPSLDPDSRARSVQAVAEPAAVTSAGPEGPNGPKAAASRPSETDSRWLHEIMERARELNDTGHPTSQADANLEAKRSAVA